jgi:error-prone DNA polymerase
MSDYVELHCHSNFSLLDGASPPQDLVSRAGELGMAALALTDHDAVYGAVRFVRAAQAHGVRPILGAELTLAGGHHLSLLVDNQAGWRNLCRLISRARHDAPKGQAALPPEELAGHTDGLIALSGCRQGEVVGALLRQDPDAALAAAGRYRNLFGPDRFWIELQHHLLPEDDALVDELVALARHLRIGYVATNDVHYARREGHRLQDVLVCIRHQTTLDEAGPFLRPNSEFHLKSQRELASLFAVYPEALANTRRIAERCRFELHYGLQDLPCFPTPPGMDAGAYLRDLCDEAIPARYSDPPSRVWEQLAHELAVIERAGLANYFLIVWDLVRFARDNGIRCQGRGSAANSLVAYLLGISPIDPLAHDLVFERFLSDERALPPDIDLDIQADRREEVIQYVYRRYGADHAAMACTLVTFQARSALRDVGKALGLPAEWLARGIQTLEDGRVGEIEAAEAADPLDLLAELCRQIDGFPRHLGIHNGGMLIMGPPLAERVPTEPATLPGRVVVQWDKEALEDVGLVKIDLLGLRMLSAISEALELIEASTGQRPDLDRLTCDDPAVYGLIARADTLGVFQVESRAQSQVLPRLRPRVFADLIVTISLIRPGPIQGQMVHPYLRRRLGLEPVTYLHPRLKPALAETLGVILFQEQVLKVARDLAGFTAGQGEQLRRALGAKRAAEEIERFRVAFLDGARALGVPEAVAEAVFAQLKAFGGYSFPKSHAAAFAVLVYQSAWLKCYYPVAFYTALLNHQPMGFWSPAVLLGDARRHGIRTLPVDIHASHEKCTLEGSAIRLGLNYVTGLGETGARRILVARQAQLFTGLADFCRRTQLPRRVVENLILAGAMDGWQVRRRKLLWELGRLHYHAEELDLVFLDDGVALPPLSQVEELAAEYGVLGLTTGSHVMRLYRSWLEERGIRGSRDLETCEDRERVIVAGLVVVHQAPPTARGYHFITLEDEDGLIDLIVRPDVYARYRRVLHAAPVLMVEGTLQRKGGVINLLARQVLTLPR